MPIIIIIIKICIAEMSLGKNDSSDIPLQIHVHVYTNYLDFKCP